MFLNVPKSLWHLQESLLEENLVYESRKNTTFISPASCMDYSFALYSFEIVLLGHLTVKLDEGKHRKDLPRRWPSCASWRSRLIGCWRDYIFWLLRLELPWRLFGASLALDQIGIDYTHHHLNLARHPVLQMALPGWLHLVRRVAIRTHSCSYSLLRDCLIRGVWVCNRVVTIFSILYGTGSTDHLSSMQLVVHDAATRLSYLREYSDRR